MMLPLIGLSGSLGSGKSTVCEIICRRFPQYKRKSFATKVRQVTELLTGVPLAVSETRQGKALPTAFPMWFDRDDSPTMTVGMVLQRVGVGLRDAIHPNVWVDAVFGVGGCEWKHAQEHGDGWVLEDCRFVNECDRVHALGGFVIRLTGDPAGVRASNVDGRDLLHVSETALDTYERFNVVLCNDSTLQVLEEQVVRLVQEWQKKSTIQ